MFASPHSRSRRRATRIALGLGLLVPCLLALACDAPDPTGTDAPATSPPSQTAEAAPPNFIVIVVDTLRADRLRFAGHARARSPRFDALAAESVWFENVYSTSSWTLPSTASLFTSQLVSKHRVSSWGSRLGPEARTFVDVLDRAGYRTAMWTANRAIAGRRGFQGRFQESMLVAHPDFERGSPLSETAFGRGETISRLALEWLGEGQRTGDPAPFFAYLHYMEPHGPYLCADPVGDPVCVETANALNLRLLTFEWSLDEREKAFLSDLYDADVSSMDAALASLLDGLESENLLENTWIVLVADHGELLGESDMYMHGRTLFDAVVRVPLLVRSPQGRAGRVATPVSLIDLAPTILELAGLEVPETFDGRSLREALEGGLPPARPIFSELLRVGAEPDPRQRHVVSIRDGQETFRLTLDGRIERVDHDRSAGDEAETVEPPSADRHLGRFDALLESAEGEIDPTLYVSPEYAEPTPEMLEQLKALGYVD